MTDGRGAHSHLHALSVAKVEKAGSDTQRWHGVRKSPLVHCWWGVEHKLGATLSRLPGVLITITMHTF